ncbi:hypothetical protein [Nocardia takedensis]|uniref:hypothetical protein n=1 Tax=Nocardia takedensis TaxID=259390 RepID=UPI0002FDE2AB|nr:hypothetical protein [Nocardia takedensis]
MNTPVRVSWRPSHLPDFGRVTVSADRGRVRDTGEVFASHYTGPDGTDMVQVTVHKEQGFAAVVHLDMTLADATAILGVLRGAITDAFARSGRSPVPSAPVRTDLAGPDRWTA